MTESPERIEGKLFRERPDIEEVKNFVSEKALLGIEKDKPLEIKDIDPKSPSGHWNFLLEQGDKRFVFRLIGDEKRITGDEIEREFTILKHVAPYDVAPKPYYFSNTEFKEPFLVEEFLEGELLKRLELKEENGDSSKAAQLLARISNIPVTESIRPNLKPIKNYEDDFKTWNSRLSEIAKSSNVASWGEEIKDFIPASQEKLRVLSKILDHAPEVFIFKSAHIGHCIKTKDGLRFLNWGDAGYGDPSYSLAVFLTSLGAGNEIVEKMANAYLKKIAWKMNKEDFKKLLDGRLFERLVANTIWPVWMAAGQQRALFSREEGAVSERIKQIKSLL